MVINRCRLGEAVQPQVAHQERLAVEEGGWSSLPLGLDDSQLGVLFGQFLKELEALCCSEPRLRQKLVSIYSRFEAAL